MCWPFRRVWNPFITYMLDWCDCLRMLKPPLADASGWYELRRHALQMKCGVKRADYRLISVADHHRDSAVVERHVPAPLHPPSQKPGQVRAVDDVMCHDQNCLSCMNSQQVLQSVGNPRIDVGKRLAAGIAELAGVAHVALVRLRVAISDGLPIQSLPLSHIAFS